MSENLSTSNTHIIPHEIYMIYSALNELLGFLDYSSCDDY